MYTGEYSLPSRAVPAGASASHSPCLGRWLLFFELQWLTHCLRDEATLLLLQSFRHQISLGSWHEDEICWLVPCLPLNVSIPWRQEFLFFTFAVSAPNLMPDTWQLSKCQYLLSKCLLQRRVVLGLDYPTGIRTSSQRGEPPSKNLIFDSWIKAMNLSFWEKRRKNFVYFFPFLLLPRGFSPLLLCSQFYL